MSKEEKIMSLAKSMGLEFDEMVVNELVNEHSQEVTTDELHALEAVTSSLAPQLFSDRCQIYSHNIFKGRKKQTSLYRFCKKRTCRGK